MIDILQSLIVVAISLYLTIYMGRKLNLGPNLAILIFSVHTLYCVIYWYLYTQIGHADAVMYYNSSLVDEFNWMPGSNFTISLTKVLTNFLKLNMFNTFLIFNMFGIIGIQFLLRVLLDIWPKSGNISSYMPYFIILLPGQSFWSSALGKDGIAYLSISILLYGLHTHKYSYLIVSVLLMFLIRPHIALVMVLSTLVVFVVSSFHKKPSKYILLLFSISSLFFGLLAVLNFLGMSSFSITNILNFIESRESLEMPGGSSYAIEGKIFIERVYNFMFAPLFFDAKNAVAIIFSLENLFILIFLIKYILFNLISMLKKIRTLIIFYSMVYSTVLIVIMSITTTNIGIALRQKYMILPFLFVLGAIAAKDYYIKSRYRKNTAER
jgi:hypothetical protein